MLVKEFISAVIQHIPDKNFRLIRYYGMYSRRKIKIVRQSTIMQKTLIEFDIKRTFHCSKCNNTMEIIAFCDKPPPEDTSKLTNWIDSFS